MTPRERLSAAIQVLKELEGKATPAPWDCGGIATISITFDHERNIFPPDTYKSHGFQYSGPVCVVQANGEAEDAPLITALRNYAPGMIYALERLLECEYCGGGGISSAPHYVITGMKPCPECTPAIEEALGKMGAK